MRSRRSCSRSMPQFPGGCEGLEAMLLLSQI